MAKTKKAANEAEEKAAKEAAEKSAKDAKAKAAKEAAGKTESIKEEQKQTYPPELIAGIKEAGYEDDPENGKDPIQRVKSYDPLGLWRVVFGDGQRREFSYEGKWLRKDKELKVGEKPPKKPAKK